MTNFQIVVTGIFAFCAFVGIFLFATFGGSSISENIGSIEVWGYLDESLIRDSIDYLQNEGKNQYDAVTYRQIDENSFDTELAEAIASGEGPDLIILSQDSILKHEAKIFKIPYEKYPVRDYRDTFIEEGELFLSDDGIIALPFVIDPLVMYWNRDIFSRKGVATPPRKWDEFFSLSQTITDKDLKHNIQTSFVPFGEFRNISNAKEIISALILQAGNPILKRENGEIIPLLGSQSENSIQKSEQAIDFFLQFSNPVKPVYTWHRALPNSTKMFLSGDLALYFGFASELLDIREKNPNLNFDVAILPQGANKNTGTFGKIYGLAIPKSSDNIGGAFSLAQDLLDNDLLSLLSETSNLPPVKRSLLSEKPSNPYMDIFYKSALLSSAWLDPNKIETSNIFKEMIENIISGRSKTSGALKTSQKELELLLKN